MPKHLLMTALIVLLSLPVLFSTHAQERSCWDAWEPSCTVTAVQVGVGLVRGGLDLLPTPPVEVCRMTPSTGLGSGVNIRALPDVESDVVGDISLGAYREVTALSTDWVQTVTRGGDAGFVAAGVAALVGPCGDVPRFVVTP